MQDTSGRIDIYGQMGLCDRGGVAVSRAMPACLNNRMDTEQWSSFCDRLDDKLEPLQKVKNINLGLIAIGGVVCVVAVIVGLATALTFDVEDYDDGWYTFFFIAFGVLGGAFIIASIYTHVQVNVVRTELRHICDEESQKSPDLSFHVRFETHLFATGGGGGTGGLFNNNNNNNKNIQTSVYNYIEVNVSHTGTPINIAFVPAAAGVVGQQAPATAPETVPAPVPASTAVVEGKTVEQRLEDLENIRVHLTDEEYEQKRKDIIASL